MHRQLALLAGSLTLAALAVAGCTSSGGGSSSDSALYRGAPANGAPAVAPSRATTPAAGGSFDSASGSATSGTLVADTRALIRTADLRVRVRAGVSVAGQADRAEDIAQAAGGQVFGDDRSSAGHGSATLTLKIPPEQLTSALRALSQLGTEVDRQLSTEDVTSRVADVNSRVNSAREAIARLRTLYGSATRVSDVIAIEDELSTREADLESLEAQQRALSAQTSLATVHLALFGAAPAVPPKKHPKADHGIGAAFARGWDAFVIAVGWVVRAVATALPFLVLALLAAGALVVAARRRRTSPPLPPAEPAAG